MAVATLAMWHSKLGHIIDIDIEAAAVFEGRRRGAG